jgi:tryptophan synthase alpha subunit
LICVHGTAHFCQYALHFTDRFFWLACIRSDFINQGRSNNDDVSKNLERIRSRVDIPVGVGFGINNGEAAAAVATVADGVIVGSALVNKIAANASQPEKAISEVQGVLAEMRSAMNANQGS